ncbi:unnamed protein product [Prorocentrum cordatum]|uniref:PDZ domain-containing protein n=1 Tax=Prorocentrum cordatum TaxID=2364126 RepID=A0ABN9S6R8_9DINO|nr:unnamed protein product [Polarella glacialis]
MVCAARLRWLSDQLALGRQCRLRVNSHCDKVIVNVVLLPVFDSLMLNSFALQLADSGIVDSMMYEMDVDGCPEDDALRVAFNIPHRGAPVVAANEGTGSHGWDGRALLRDGAGGGGVEALLAELLKPLADAQKNFQNTLERSFGSHGLSSGAGAAPARIIREIVWHEEEYEDDGPMMPLAELCQHHAWPLELFVGRFVTLLGGPWIGRVAKISGICEGAVCLEVYPDDERPEADPMIVYECGNPASTPQWDGMMVEKITAGRGAVAAPRRPPATARRAAAPARVHPCGRRLQAGGEGRRAQAPLRFLGLDSRSLDASEEGSMRMFSGAKASKSAAGKQVIPTSPTEQESSSCASSWGSSSSSSGWAARRARSWTASSRWRPASRERRRCCRRDAVPRPSWTWSSRQKSTVSSPVVPSQLIFEDSPAVMKEALFASRSRSPRDTHVALYTERGSPAVVETFLKDGSCFRTLEPPEMMPTPRSLSTGPSACPVMGCVVPQPRAGEDEPLCEEPPPTRSAKRISDIPVVPRLSLPSLPPCQKLRTDLSGPKWGVPQDAFCDEASSQADTEHLNDPDIPKPEVEVPRVQGRAPPWDREPDEGSVQDNTAAWLWQVDLPEGEDGYGTGGLGIEVQRRDDLDRLVVISVSEGRVANWNKARPRRVPRVEIGDMIVGVGACQGGAAQLFEQLGRHGGAGWPTLSPSGRSEGARDQSTQT